MCWHRYPKHPGAPCSHAEPPRRAHPWATTQEIVTAQRISCQCRRFIKLALTAAASLSLSKTVTLGVTASAELHGHCAVLGCSLSGASCTSTPALRRAPTLHEIQGREGNRWYGRYDLIAFSKALVRPTCDLCSSQFICPWSIAVQKVCTTDAARRSHLSWSWCCGYWWRLFFYFLGRRSRWSLQPWTPCSRE